MEIESEKKLEKLLSALIKEMGGLSIKLLSTYLVGLPDRICLLPGGRLFFAEIKTTNQKPRKIQLWMHEKLRDLGFEVYVLDSTEKIKQLLKSV